MRHLELRTLAFPPDHQDETGDNDDSDEDFKLVVVNDVPGECADGNAG